MSGGHSQRIKELNKGVPHGRMGIGAFVDLDALLLKQQERQQIPEVVKEMQHRQAVHNDGTFIPLRPPENRRSKTTETERSTLINPHHVRALSLVPTWMTVILDGCPRRVEGS